MTTLLETEEAVATEPARRRRRLTPDRSDMLWLSVGTAVVTLLMFLFGLWGSGGHLAPPLDDTFIHFQYARQAAHAHPFEYNTGDPPSSGASSFIYPFLLMPAYLLGLDGQKPLLFANLLNFAAHLALVLLLYKLALRLGGPLWARPLALFSAVFVLLDGRLNYSFLTGMETGLYTAALVVFFWAWLRAWEGGSWAWVALVGMFAALLRVEGHVLVSLACVLTLAYLWRSRRLAVGRLWLVAPVLVGLVPYLVNLILTGDWQFNTAASKSTWYVPYVPLHENLSLAAGWAINAMKNIYLGLEVGTSPFPVLAAAVTVLGACYALSDRRYRLLHALMLLTLVGGIGLALMLPPIHFHRYYQPYDPLVWLYFSFGLVWLVRAAWEYRVPSAEYRVKEGAGSDNGQDATTDAEALGTRYSVLGTRYFLWAGIAVVVLILPQFVRHFFAFSDSTRDIYYQQMAFSDWIRYNTPPDARIGVNDTGAHKYMSDRYVIDLIGLTNNRLRGAYFGGWGTVFDRLVQMPEEQRPDYILIHPNVFLNGIDESVSQSLLSPVYSIRVTNPIVTAGDTEVLYSVDWGYALLDPTKTYALHKGREPLDTLNIGNLENEKAHAYRPVGRQPSIAEPKTIVTTAGYEGEDFALSDSGRRHSGWEEFTVRSVPGQPLTIVSRSRLRPDSEQRLMVWANGRQVGLWEMYNEVGGSWQEYEYTIPAEFITGERTTIRVDATFDPGGPGFASYRYWVYSP